MFRKDHGPTLVRGLAAALILVTGLGLGGAFCAAEAIQTVQSRFETLEIHCGHMYQRIRTLESEVAKIHDSE